ncbi:Calcium-regulated actin-bundling protein (34 kDa actin-binding protein), partial [Durusdinium trenchii]
QFSRALGLVNLAEPQLRELAPQAEKPTSLGGGGEMGDEDDWDTSGHTEQAPDPYNKFGSASSPGKVTAEVSKMSVEDSSLGTPSLPVANFEKAAAEAGAAPAAIPDAGAPAPPSASEEVEEATKEEEVVEEVAVAPPPAPEPPVVSAPPEPAPAAPASPLPKPAVSKPVTSPASARKGSVPIDAPDFLKEEHHGEAFTEKLSEEALAFFNDLCEKPFQEQAVSFLNAYWTEVGSQAEFIFTVAYDVMKYADMHAKGVQYVHLYNEGNDLDFNIGLYFYEKLCKKVLDDDDGKKWRDDPQWQPSMPAMMTAIKRKIELREKVDVNFDGRVSFLEYLLYQYREFANPADFTHRAMKVMDLEEHPEIVKARKALEEVNKAIMAYEAEKHRLTELSQKPG